MSNLNSMMRKVSIGANSLGESSPKRGRSRRKWDLDNAHPMHTLNQIKDIQRNHPFDQNSFGTDPFGLPLQGFNSATQGYPNNDLLRRSFERIVSYHGEPYRNHLERNQSLPTLPTYGHQQFHPIHRSYSLNDNVLRNNTLEYGSQPFRKVAISKDHRDYARLQYEENLDSGYKLTTRRRTSAQSLSSNSGSSNSFSFQKRQLCPKCANCPTCVVQQSYTGSSDNGFGSETQRPSIFNQSRFRPFIHPSDDSTSRRVNFANSIHSDSSSSASSSGDESSQPNESLNRSFDRSVNPAMLCEYEKWKSSYGINRGRSMKRGMSKLSSAFL